MAYPCYERATVFEDLYNCAISCPNKTTTPDLNGQFTCTHNPNMGGPDSVKQCEIVCKPDGYPIVVPEPSYTYYLLVEVGFLLVYFLWKRLAIRI